MFKGKWLLSLEVHINDFNFVSPQAGPPWDFQFDFVPIEFLCIMSVIFLSLMYRLSFC